MVDNELMVFHGAMSTHHSFTEVLTDLFDFLHKTPEEVVLMRLKEEMGTPRYEGNPNITFQQAFAHYITKNPTTKHGAHKHIWIPEVMVELYQAPTLGELRGKIMILQDFGADTAIAEFGIHWGSTLLEIEDAYNIPEKEGVAKKETAVQDSLIRAMKGMEGEGDGKLYLTYLSGSGGIESMNLAAGEGGINDQTDLDSQKSEKGSLGIVVMDVPGAQLVEKILKRNPIGKTPSDWSGLQLDGEDTV